MARRRSGARLARAQRAISDSPAEVAFIEVLQDFKLIDLKSRLIRRASKLLPFWYVGFGISILALLPFRPLRSWMLVVVSSQIFGPVGLRTRRKKHRADIARIRQRFPETFAKLDPGVRFAVFGIQSIKRAGLSLSVPPQKVTASMADAISDDGVLPLGDYKYLAVVPLRANGKPDISHPDLKSHFWLMQAARKKIPQDQILQSIRNPAARVVITE